MLEIENKLTANFGYLFEEKLITEIKQLGTLKKVKEDSTIIEVGDYIKSIPLINFWSN